MAVYWNEKFFNFFIVDGKEGMGENNGGWSYPQLTSYAARCISEISGEAVGKGTSCPILGLEIMGHHIRCVCM